MTPPARATVWVESRGFPEMAFTLYLPVTAISFILSHLGGMGAGGGALPGMLSRSRAARGERGRRVWQGQSGAFGPASSKSPPLAQSGTESHQVRGHRRLASLEEAGALGWLPVSTAVAEGPGFLPPPPPPPLPTARPCWGRPPSLGILTACLQGAL